MTGRLRPSHLEWVAERLSERDWQIIQAVYTISDLTDEANDLGLRLLATKSLPEHPLLPQQMHRILRNRYYIGVVTYGGVEYPGDHDSWPRLTVERPCGPCP